LSESGACSFWLRYLRSDAVGRLEMAKRVAEVIYPCALVSDRSTAVLCIAEYLRAYFDDLLRCLDHPSQSSSPSESLSEPQSPADSSD